METAELHDPCATVGSVPSGHQPDNIFLLLVNQIMRKISTPQDLHAELNRLLAYSQSENPSRERLASALRDLASRVAAKSDLRPQDLKRGLEIMEMDHPEHGVWFVVRPYHGMWEVARSSRPSDVKVVDEAELMRFWRKAKPGDRTARSVTAQTPDLVVARDSSID